MNSALTLSLLSGTSVVLADDNFSMRSKDLADARGKELT